VSVFGEKPTGYIIRIERYGQLMAKLDKVFGQRSANPKLETWSCFPIFPEFYA